MSATVVRRITWKTCEVILIYAIKRHGYEKQRISRLCGLCRSHSQMHVAITWLSLSGLNNFTLIYTYVGMYVLTHILPINFQLNFQAYCKQNAQILEHHISGVLRFQSSPSRAGYCISSASAMFNDIFYRQSHPAYNNILLQLHLMEMMFRQQLFFGTIVLMVATKDRCTFATPHRFTKYVHRKQLPLFNSQIYN